MWEFANNNPGPAVLMIVIVAIVLGVTISSVFESISNAIIFRNTPSPKEKEEDDIDEDDVDIDPM